MTFQEQQKKINACYKGYHCKGIFVTRSFGRLRNFDKRFLKKWWRQILPF